MAAESLARQTVETDLGARMSEAEWKRLRSDPAFDALLDSPRDDVLAAECAGLVQRWRDDRRTAKVEAAVRRDARREPRNAHLQALTYALTADAYARASGVRPWDRYEERLAGAVRRFRAEVLGGRFPLKVADVEAWATPHIADLTDTTAPPITLPKPNDRVTLARCRPGGVLERLQGLARELAEHFRWGDEASGAAFVLCDGIAIVSPIQTTHTPHHVMMKVHDDASYEEVRAAYRQARSDALGGPSQAKSLGERTLRAAGFSALRWQREWPDIYGEWCRRNSDDDGYADWRAFRRAALTGLRAL